MLVKILIKKKIQTKTKQTKQNRKKKIIEAHFKVLEKKLQIKS